MYAFAIPRGGFVAAISLLIALPGLAAEAASSAAPAPVVREQVHGHFEVKLKPLGDAVSSQGVTLGRMSLDKHFHGALDARGEGEMLTALTGNKGSAGYVAMERVSGSLQGRQGSFVLQHSGSMQAGAQSLTIEVVPDSASGDLVGLRGSMRITVRDGQHLYDFDYTLPVR
jgi:hypothetical protein